jgi:hypothetical protein
LFSNNEVLNTFSIILFSLGIIAGVITLLGAVFNKVEQQRLELLRKIMLTSWAFAIGVYILSWILK